MMGIWDYATALRAIWRRSAYDRGFISNPFAGDASLGLVRTRALVDRLGAPDRHYGILHVAGSKGKGSTCAFTAAMLREAGYRTGCYTSPHLHSFRERIAINGVPIVEADFAALTERAVSATTTLEQEQTDLGQVTAFELLTAMALDHFAASGCQLAVVEVGLGGTLDATNIVTPLAAAITTLDYEHTAILGDTIEEIAGNKAGIIKPGRPVAVSPQLPAALAVITDVATLTGSRLLVAGRDWQWEGDWRSLTASGPWGAYRNLRLGLAGPHQVENACTALALTYLAAEAGFPVTEAAVRAGLAKAVWPGRFERISGPDGRTVVLDGAHSPAAAAALAATLAAEFPNRRATIILGVLGDKNPLAVARPLQPVAQSFIVTRSASPRSREPEAIADALAPIGVQVSVASNIPAAWTAAVAETGNGDLIVATGSLSIVAELRELLGLAEPEAAPA